MSLSISPNTGRLSPTGPKVRAGFMAETGSNTFTSWNPALREARDDVRAGWASATARTTQLSQNNGFIAGGIDQSTGYIVGTGLNLNANPDAQALGWSAERAREWARSVERRFESFANAPMECDAEGRATLHQLVKSAVNGWHRTGEIFALLPFERHPGCRFGTKLRLLPPNRLTQHTQDDWFQGIQLSGNGRPLAYRVSNRTSTAYRAGDFQDSIVTARDKWGRAKVAHIFDGLPGQVRGISVFAPVLATARQYDQLSGATLTASIIQAIMVGTVTSDMPTAEVMEAFKSDNDVSGSAGQAYMEARANYHGGANIDIGRFGKIAHLMTGEKFDFHGSKHPNDTYEAFASFLLREIARCCGITFEDLTGDYRGSTYSSVRAAVAAMWIPTLQRRAFIASPLYQVLYELWMEEAIDSGEVDVPGGMETFLSNRVALCRSKWRGQGRPQPDDLKTAKAQAIWKQMGVMTDEMIANELGVDIEDVYEQLNRERIMREEKGLPDTALTGVNGDLLKSEPENADGSAA